MATASALTTLLKNLEVNLKDTTNFTGLSQLKWSAKTQHIVAVFLPVYQGSVPFFQIAPGACAKANAVGRVDTQQVLVHVCWGIVSDPQGYYTLAGTAALDSIGTLMEEIEKALTRPEPYNHAPYNTGSYTAQTNVHAAYPVEWTPVQPLDFPGIEGRLFMVQTLTMEYHIEKGL